MPVFTDLVTAFYFIYGAMEHEFDTTADTSVPRLRVARIRPAGRMAAALHAANARLDVAARTFPQTFASEQGGQTCWEACV